MTKLSNSQITQAATQLLELCEDYDDYIGNPNQFKIGQEIIGLTNIILAYHVCAQLAEDHLWTTQP